ncbi:hypothetical protein BO71DRAFT_453570 [Aspergillus ellipticus CBS 707.79]|uniref:AB hydrolase-1 domain-containing protein n=1 Tax=Aspergillus ellipticus CBS 707.79 TaxID=1448320 RepID=A0A319DDW8_9EURO|nr:hypothetical protein BO71DRAFT_453570 [Aspergillus ellipticus CBS 707.79]
MWSDTITSPPCIPGATKIYLNLVDGDLSTRVKTHGSVTSPESETLFLGIENVNTLPLILLVRIYCCLLCRAPPWDRPPPAAHANGLPKELYEPLWEELDRHARGHGVRIRRIWMADVAHQGQSGRMNDGRLGNDPHWFDHSRDLLHLVNTRRADMPPPLVGIGHSMGGTQLAQLSLIYPSLFTTLVLFDPVIQRPATPLQDGTLFDHRRLLCDSTCLSTHRRDRWPSRAAANQSLGRHPVHRAWDPRVLRRWIEYGLRRDSPGVTLTTTIPQEVLTFARPCDHSGPTPPDLDPALRTTFPFYRPEPSLAFRDLPHLRPGVLYVIGEHSLMARPELRADKLRATGTGMGGSGGVPAGRVREVVLPRCGHLVVQEAMGECAEVAASWIGAEVRRPRRGTEGFPGHGSVLSKL